MDRLLIRRSAWEAVIAHLRGALPDEGVGFLLGSTPAEADRFVPARNVRSGRRFLVDPYDQFAAFREARAGGHQVVALIHSHPGGGVTLSVADWENAVWWPFLQVIVAFPAEGGEPAAAAWRCGLSGATPVDLVVAEPASE